MKCNFDVWDKIRFKIFKELITNIIKGVNKDVGKDVKLILDSMELFEEVLNIFHKQYGFSDLKTIKQKF